jgi:hypothetical protein
MSAGAHRPFVSIKFSPVGRTYTFLLPDLALDDEGVAPRIDWREAARRVADVDAGASRSGRERS